MTTITISERLYTLMVRATKVHWNRLLEHAKEHSSTDEARRDYNNRGLSEQTFYTLKVNEFEFQLDYSLQIYHECENFDDDNVINLLDDCSCDKNVNYIINLKRGGTYLFNKIIYEKTVEEALKIVGSIPVSYELCKCGDIAEQDEWCIMCYVHRYTRTEAEGGVCCCCYENEGRWIRLECKHELHQHCFNKLASMLCPLCRAPVKYNEVKRDCYDC